MARAGREAIDAKLYEPQEARRPGGSVYGKRAGVLGMLSLAARDPTLCEVESAREASVDDGDLARIEAERDARLAFIAAKQEYADAAGLWGPGSPEELEANRKLERLRASGAGRS